MDYYSIVGTDFNERAGKIERREWDEERVNKWCDLSPSIMSYLSAME